MSIPATSGLVFGRDGQRGNRQVLQVTFDGTLQQPGGALPQGHDAWVVGDEPVVAVDWYGASDYASDYARG